MTHQEASVSTLAAGFIPPLALDFGSEMPLYRQIFTWFQRAVLSGKLQPGERVPSTRALAKDLCISRIPVLSAYELLIAEGYLQAFVGTGTCVSRSLRARDIQPRPGGAPGGRRQVTTGEAHGLAAPQRGSCPR